MTPAIPPDSQTPDVPAGSDLSLSLPLAASAIAHRAGYELDLDALCAVLGLSWTAITVPSEPDLARWPLYARDAFVVDAARLFGLTLRPLHPPEAARGLEVAAEFEQHFDASYRPLILRALENDQPVLAWRGWPQVKDTAIELAWGLVEVESQQGCGFEGIVLGGRTENHSRLLILERPPVQLYVVENVEPTQPDRDELFDMALSHARLVMNNMLQDRFDVLTGPQAYDLWIERLRSAPMPLSPLDKGGDRGGGPSVGRARTPAEPHGAENDRVALLPAHLSLAASLIAAHESAIRFLQSYKQSGRGKNLVIIEAVSALCQTVVSCLQGAATAATQSVDLADSQTRDSLTNVLTHARKATVALSTVLR